MTFSVLARCFSGGIFALLATSAIQAQSFSDYYYNPQLMPSRPSARDARYVGFRSYCGGLPLESPVVLEVSGYDAALDLKILPHNSVCTGTPPPNSSVLYLVELPRSLNILDLHVRLLQPDGQILIEKHLSVPASTDIPASVTGTWRDPAHTAQGLIVSAAPVSIFNNGLTVAWTTYDANGNPLWLVGAAPMGETEFLTSIPLYATRGGTFPGRSGSDASVEAWGTISLEYQGCGHMDMSWNAIDATTFPPGRMTLSQLTHNTIENCDVIGDATRRGKRFVLIAPQVTGTR